MRGASTHAIALALAAAAATGCWTIPGELAPIDVPAPGSVPSIEHTVGEFTFAIGSAEPKPSLLDGELLGNEIMDAWKERGYIRDEEFVDPGSPFSGNAQYQLTLSGQQHNDSSFWLEVLNAFTLMLSPYWVTHAYDLHVVLEETKSGITYQAIIQASDETCVEILLLFALPVAHRGHDATMQSVGDHLYDQLQRQGAFRSEAPDPIEVRAPIPSTSDDPVVQSCAPGE